MHIVKKKLRVKIGPPSFHPSVPLSFSLSLPITLVISLSLISTMVPLFELRASRGFSPPYSRRLVPSDLWSKSPTSAASLDRSSGVVVYTVRV